MTTLAFENQPGSFWRRFGPLFAAGALGIVSLVPTVSTLVTDQIAKVPNPPALPLPLITALSLIQPTLLLAGAVAVGVALASRLGLRSHIAERAVTRTPLLPALRRELPLASAVGAGSGFAMAALDIALRSLTGVSLLTLGQQAVARLTLSGTAMRLLYGGITEELLMRWGLMTLVAWLLWRTIGRGREQTRSAIMWAAIAIVAIIFGLGHLPVASMVTQLTPLLVAQVIVINALGGIAFGCLYWRRSLEAAMIAHAMAHVVFMVGLATGVIA
jgi:hypothetical protein